MRTLKRIVDYINSWLYYPKMEKYFKGIGLEKSNPWYGKRFARFKYSWWHCHAGKLKDRSEGIGKEFVKTFVKEWKSIYDCEPIEK